MNMRSLIAASLVVVCLSLLSGCAGQNVTFPNVKDADIPVARGILTIPEGHGPFPVVVILHGCSGLKPNGDMWASYLRDHGYASLVMDGFGPRGVYEICTDFNRVPTRRRLLDLKAALQYLASRPEIAVDRAAIMGFSNGAVVTLDAASRFGRDSIAEGPLTYRAAIALYPECRFRSSDFGLPALILIGDRDDWTLASSCQELQQRTQPGSPAPELVVYPGAQHAFDDLRANANLPHVRNINSPSGFGASVGGDGPSLERAKVDVLDFLRRQLQ